MLACPTFSAGRGTVTCRVVLQRLRALPVRAEKLRVLFPLNAMAPPSMNKRTPTCTCSITLDSSGWP